jgi:quinoprotein glucose dehydrogenase
MPRMYWMSAVLSVAVMCGCNPGPDAFTNWSMYEGDAGASHFSALTQINKSNVQDLEIAWTYVIEDNSAPGMNPLIVDNTMYVVGTRGAVIALNAETGEERWTHPFSASWSRDRGILYWESEDRSDRRTRVGIPYDSTSGRSRLRHLGRP